MTCPAHHECQAIPGRGPNCGGEVLCPGCLRLVGWCMTNDDDEPHLCNHCWYTLQPERWTEAELTTEAALAW